MSRAIALTRRPAVKAERVVATVTLDHRARALGGAAARLTADNGLEVEIALPAPVVAGDGDALKLEDGGLVLVRAAPERVLEVRAENPARLLRAALLAGGAHAGAEAAADALYLQADDALAEAIRGLGCAVTPVERPFSPERLAVHDCCGHHHHHHDHGHHHPGHGHDHGHGCGCDHHHHGHGHEHGRHDHDHGGHDHSHAHAHGHGHDDAHAARHGHDHGCGCGCDHHGHGHSHDHK
ncbi:urease accessory protein UreE [Camelimonas abortus]|uniref:Urease accessory protein UreE n=1 Tax=Camelimonas abortus TaxID=1017184 RepID=A0ABV7LDQ5_9HYPH